MVNDEREATILLTVCATSGRKRCITAVIDTGFDGWLTLPQSELALLGLPWRPSAQAVLADGSSSIFDVFEGTVILDRRRRLISIDSADTTPLAGMALFEGYEMNIEVKAGGRVTIRRLS
jgi:clan AA aspartic protease